MTTNICFVELALADGKPFDGLTTSTRRGSPFIDMHGKEVEITQADLEQMVVNTKTALESTKTESGELVGLPIDARGHDQGDGAGWIMDVSLSGDILRITPNWTEIGINLIKKKIRRLFSASLNLTDKVILGGTLTNWPAVRGSDGRLLLRPIELSNDLQVIDFAEQEGYMPAEEIKFDQLPKGEQAKLRHQALAELQAEFDADKGAAEPVDLESVKANLMESMMVRARAELETEMAAELASQKRQTDIAEFCANVTGGTAEVPAGLPVQADRLAAVLGKLEDDKDRAELEAMLAAVVEKGLVKFEENGHSRHTNGKAQLEEPYKRQLKAALAAGHSAEKFFKTAEVLGSADDYDLTEFEAGD